MGERRTTDQEALHDLRDSAVNFLDSLHVKPEQDFAGAMELSIGMCGAERPQDSASQPGTWKASRDTDGILLNMSAKMKAGTKPERGAFYTLKPYAVRFLDSLSAWSKQSYSDAMEMFLKLYEAVHSEGSALDEKLERCRISGRNRTLLQIDVSLVPEEDKKYIGRKFEAVHRSRELAVQFLYSMDIRPDQEFSQALELFLSLDDVAQGDKPDVKARCREMASQVQEKKDEIDGFLLRVVTGWRPERMMSVDRVILRLMVLEGFILKTLPVRSAITEARDLARSFGTDDSPRFVNGVMHKMAKYFEGGESGDARG